MGDLISRKALFKAWDGLSDEIKDSNLLIDEMIRRTQDAEAVNAVRVVRCKDCAFWRKEVSGTKHWVCIQHSFDGREMHTMPDFFCKDGRETW